MRYSAIKGEEATRIYKARPLWLFVVTMFENLLGKNTRKGQVSIQSLLPFVAFLGIAGIFSAYMLLTTSEVQADMTADTAEYNAAGDAITGIGNLTAKFDIIGTLAAIVIILGMLMGLYYMFSRTR